MYKELNLWYYVKYSPRFWHQNNIERLHSIDIILHYVCINTRMYIKSLIMLRVTQLFHRVHMSQNKPMYVTYRYISNIHIICRITNIIIYIICQLSVMLSDAQLLLRHLNYICIRFSETINISIFNLKSNFALIYNRNVICKKYIYCIINESVSNNYDTFSAKINPRVLCVLLDSYMF